LLYLLGGTNIYSDSPNDKKEEAMAHIGRVDVIFHYSSILAIISVATLTQMTTLN
jgi:hypothetical protein